MGQNQRERFDFLGPTSCSCSTATWVLLLLTPQHMTIPAGGQWAAGQFSVSQLSFSGLRFSAKADWSLPKRESTGKPQGPAPEVRVTLVFLERCKPEESPVTY